MIASLHCPVLLISLGSRIELRIEILRGIPSISCLHGLIKNSTDQLELQKIFYDASIKSQQHAVHTRYMPGATAGTLLSILAPLIFTTTR